MAGFPLSPPTARRVAPNGTLVLDKPRGPTSHDVVFRVRRALGVREVGHAGTLDPMATGVLVLALGEATKLVPWLTAAHKTYEATIALGVETDTLDADGREVSRVEPGEALREALREARALRVPKLIAEALAAERGRTRQVPPAFSAIRTGGERSYERARRGEAAELAPRDVVVRALALLDAGEDRGVPFLAVGIEVSKGYYVRALARDLARELGTVGHLTSLRRTASGSFDVREALPVDTPPEELEARVLPLAHAATRALPAAYLTAVGARDAKHGRAVRLEDIEPSVPGPRAWLGPDGKLVAVGEVGSDGLGHVLRGFGG